MQTTEQYDEPTLNLKQFDSQPWSVLFHAPSEFIDYTSVFDVFDPRYLRSGYYAVFHGRIKNAPQTTWHNKRPRTQFVIHDGQDTISFSLFGDQRSLTERYQKGEYLSVYGVIQKEGKRVYLNNPIIVPKSQLGRLSPVYKYPNQTNEDEFLDQVDYALKHHLSDAVSEIRSFISSSIPNIPIKPFLSGPYPSLDKLILGLHRPTSNQAGLDAIAQSKKLSSLLCAISLHKLANQTNACEVKPLIGVDPKTLSKNMPFSPTDEQMKNVMEVIHYLYHGKKLHGLLIGDVGSGKTCVYAIISAYTVSAGGRAAIMLPNQNLAQQVFDELSAYYPDTDIALITGNTKSKISHAQIMIGTTALLFRDIGSVSLVVCDEQQRMSISQRNQLLSQDTHLLEVSATPIPRSLALATYGAVKIFTLKKCHVKKNIETTIVESHRKQELMTEISNTVSRGKQVLVICARCEGDKKEKGVNLISAEFMFEGLSKFYPGQVAIAHSRLGANDNARSISDMKSGKADILVSTTVVEVGLTINDAQLIIIANPERLGISQLHQLRGRVGRTGGDAKCILYTPDPITKEETIQRLKFVESTNDGFELSKHDLHLRGGGDILFHIGQQHGQSATLFREIDVTMAEIDTAFEFINNPHLQ